MLYSKGVRVPFLVFSLVLIGAARAQLFPAVPKSGTVYDGARLLSAADVRTLNATSQEFKSREGAPIVVATLPSLESVGAKDLGIERYATALFDQWRIGRKERNVGILLLVAKADRKVRVELGKDLGHDYDAAVRKIQRSKILPAFKRGDYAGGIVAGAKALSRLPDSAPASTPPPSAAGNVDASSSLPQFDPEPSMNPLFPFGALLCLGVPILFFVAIIVAVVRRGRSYSAGGYNSNFRSGPNGPIVNNTSIDNRNDGFTEGLIAGQIMSQPVYDPTPPYDPGPSIDTGPSYDTSPSFDSGSSSDSGGSSDSGSFDSGSSGGGGDTGSW